jgi:hypothetical protein
MIREAMEYGSWKASSDVLKPHYIYMNDYSNKLLLFHCLFE